MVRFLILAFGLASIYTNMKAEQDKKKEKLIKKKNNLQKTVKKTNTINNKTNFENKPKNNTQTNQSTNTIKKQRINKNINSSIHNKGKNKDNEKTSYFEDKIDLRNMIISYEIMSGPKALRNKKK